VPIITSLFNAFNAPRIKRIEYFKNHPLEVQERVFFKLLDMASNTVQGKKYGYREIRSIESFQERVPLVSYEDLLPEIGKLRHGATDLLWPGEVKWFAKSSGTTSTKSKFIPVTREALRGCHYRGITDLLAIYSRNFPENRLFYGRALTLGGSHKINPEGNHALSGDLSAILLENAPRISEFWKSPDKNTALVDDFERKLELITSKAVGQNITSMSGVPSWYLTLIKYVLKFTGKKDLSDVWPNLEVFFHGGISFVPYRDIYKSLIGSDKMKYMETYNASEGFFGIQDDLDDSAMLLMLDNGVFYEFIPADRADDPDVAAVSLRDVVPGVNYSVVITTDSGLWRYKIGDTIVFTSTSPYKFRISGRVKQYINAFGEEVIVDNADRAIKAASEATGATVTEYTAGPVYMEIDSRGGHEWIIEFEREPDSLENFAEVLDRTLKEVNSDYEAKRYKDINLVKPLIRAAPGGTFNRWMKSRDKLGGQNKVPRLANNRDYLESLARFL
jgi:hypothetical protein